MGIIWVKMIMWNFYLKSCSIYDLFLNGNQTAFIIWYYKKIEPSDNKHKLIHRFPRIDSLGRVGGKETKP